MTVVLSTPDLRALAASCQNLGLELVSGRHRFRYRQITEDIIPSWLKDTDRDLLGKRWDNCDHVIRLSSHFSDHTRETAHEIGLYVDRKYRMIAVADLGIGGESLADRIGLDGGRLLYAYRAAMVDMLIDQHEFTIVDRYVSRNNTLICTLVGDTMTPGNTGEPRRIRIKVHPDGRTELEVLSGFSGPACEAFTQGFIDAVGGRTVGTTNKPEHSHIAAAAELNEGIS